MEVGVVADVFTIWWGDDFVVAFVVAELSFDEYFTEGFLVVLVPFCEALLYFVVLPADAGEEVDENEECAFSAVFESFEDEFDAWREEFFGEGLAGEFYFLGFFYCFLFEVGCVVECLEDECACFSRLCVCSVEECVW